MTDSQDSEAIADRGHCGPRSRKREKISRSIDNGPRRNIDQ